MKNLCDVKKWLPGKQYKQYKCIYLCSFIGLLPWYDIVTNKKEANKMVALFVIGIIFYIPLAVIFKLAGKYT